MFPYLYLQWNSFIIILVRCAQCYLTAPELSSAALCFALLPHAWLHMSGCVTYVSSDADQKRELFLTILILYFTAVPSGAV